MDVILIMLWVSLGLVSLALIALFYSVKLGDADYSDKLALMPLDDKKMDSKTTKSLP